MLKKSVILTHPAQARQDAPFLGKAAASERDCRGSTAFGKLRPRACRGELAEVPSDRRLSLFRYAGTARLSSPKSGNAGASPLESLSAARTVLAGFFSTPLHLSQKCEHVMAPIQKSRRNVEDLSEHFQSSIDRRRRLIGFDKPDVPGLDPFDPKSASYR